MAIIPEKIEIDFTDERITGSAGSVFVSAMARRLGLPRLLEGIGLKRRRRGATDCQMMLSLIYSLARGDGALLDVDRLGADEARKDLLGLSVVPGHRRLGEYLARFDREALGRLEKVSEEVAGKIAPAVIKQELREQGYVGVFMDGSAIEVSGEQFEGARTGYAGERQYWLHGAFVGGLWASQRLLPGDVHPAKGWQEELQRTGELIGDRGPVWVRLDNAYYQKEVAEFCASRGWGYSISVTSETYKRPLREMMTVLEDEDWEPLNAEGTEHATFLYHRPRGWKEQVYVAVRTEYEGKQRLMYPRYTFILVSTDELELAELVSRHRGKQGQENALKGPLIHLDLHHPPCRRFNANRAFYTVGQIAQMLLVAVQYNLLPQEARRHGIRTVMRDLIRTAGKLVRHARKWKLLFSKGAPRLHWIHHAAGSLERLAHAPPS